MKNEKKIKNEKYKNIKIFQVSQVMKPQRSSGLKGQKAHSPGHRPGYADKCEFRPVRAKDLYLMTILLPLQGAYMAVIRYPGGFQDGTITCSIWETCPGLTSYCPFGALSY